MRKLLQFLFRLPPEARLLTLLLAIVAPLLLMAAVLPAELVGWLVGGVLVMFAALFAVLLFYRVRIRLQGRRLDREISGQLSGPSRRELAEKDREYRQKWLAGVEKLKKAKISLYDLPWYILLGEPGGGKTMTLLNSGMDFPMGKDELPGFGGTRNYNWWFTNTAIILDTAGRLVFEQEGTSDRHEWEAFLKLLKRRRRCPINGVVVALPADKLMSDSAEVRERSAAVIRDRLRQIQSGLGVRFPVFLLLTKSDLIAGFTEFFNDLDSLQRNQLFGWSRPGDFDAAYDPREFGVEFDALYRRLHELRLHFLARKASDVELGWVHTYPDGFRTLKDRIQDYMDVVFSQNIFAEPLFFRGFYFTSSLQEGRPFLELLGQHLSGEKLENLEGLFPQSRAFFIHDFYTRKVAREQGMVFRSQKHINRTRLLRRSTLMIGVPLFILVSFLTVLGYVAYSHAVSSPVTAARQAAELTARYRTLQQQGKAWEVPADSGDAARAAEMVTALDQAVQAFRNPSGLATLMFSSIGPQAEAYLRQVQRELIGYCILRPEVARVERALAAESPLTPQQLADFQASLQTYLRWHFGRSGTELDSLRRILQSGGPLPPASAQALERFAALHNGNLAAGLNSDHQQRRQIIDAAVLRAKTYWESSANVEQHPDFAWWRRLLERCTEVHSRYRDLLAGSRRFEEAAGRRELLDAVTTWLESFPQPDTAGGASAEPNTLLLQPLKDHLRGAPRREAEGPIIQADELLEANHRKASAFWQQCLAALPAPEENVPDEVAAEAAALQERLRNEEQALSRHFEAQRGTLLGRLREMDTVIRPRPSRAPVQYEFVDSALTAQKVLNEQVAAPLRDLEAELPSSIERWSQQIEQLSEEPKAEVRFELEPEWDGAGLKRLVSSADRARQRFQSQLILDEIARKLAEPTSEGLVHFLDGYDDDGRAKSLRFPGLKNRHAESFLRQTLSARRQLETVLADAARRGDVRDDPDIRRLLEDSCREYVQHYLASWSDAYSRHRLDAVERFGFDRPGTWEEYRNWLRRNGSELQRSYRDHLDALLEHAVKPFAKGSDLASLLETVDWPSGSKLEPLVQRAVAGQTLPDAERAAAAWDKFEDGIEGARLSSLEDLTRGSVSFPRLGPGDSGAATLQGEWLTQQMQFVVDYGRWLWWIEIRKLLVSRLEPFAGRKPLIFEGGQAEQVDLLALRSVLADISRVRRWQHEAAAAPDPNEAGGLSAWLERAEAWHRFMAAESFELDIAYEPPAPGSGKSGPAEIYTKVVLSLPGMSGPDGRSLEELTFDAGKAAARQVRWKPEAGGVVVALFELNPALQVRDAAIQPRVLELPREEYPLLGLLSGHGSEGPDGWRIELSKNVREIQGLGALSIEPEVRWLLLKIRFLDADGGLPQPLPWLEASDSARRLEPPWQGE